MKMYFSTKSRREFTNACHMIATAFDINEHHTLTIDIMGWARSGKSLVADSFLTAFNHEQGPYKVPVLDRMSLESCPSEASGKLIQKEVVVAGKLREVFFLRSLMDIEYPPTTNSPSLIFMSRNCQRVTPQADIRISTISSLSEIGVHNWTVTIENSGLLTEKMNNVKSRFQRIDTKRQAISRRAFAP